MNTSLAESIEDIKAAIEENKTPKQPEPQPEGPAVIRRRPKKGGDGFEWNRTIQKLYPAPNDEPWGKIKRVRSTPTTERQGQ